MWHLVSIVEGKIRATEDYASLIKACFPGGSITGCPKIRSMEIIDELLTGGIKEEKPLRVTAGAGSEPVR